MLIRVSRWAADQIADCGGRIYLWQEPFGGPWLTHRIGFHDPNIGVRFRSFGVAGIHVLIADDVELPEKLVIRHAPWPLRGVRVEGDHKVWGRRAPD